MKSNYKKDNQPITSSIKPTNLYLQTRPFTPDQSDPSQVNEIAEGNSIQAKDVASENLLEKLISSPTSESSTSPIRRNPFSSKRMSIQAKLSIGEPNDKYEKEADNTAAKVVQQINSTSQDNSVQKQEGKKDLLQRSSISKIQRNESMEREDEEVQMKSLVQKRENIGGGEASEDLESSIQSARGGGQSLDPNVQTKMDQAMGADFSDVKIHTDSQSDRLNRSIQAKAFTTGRDIFFKQGEYNPSSNGGQELLAHELTHVVQQNNGVLQKRVELNGASDLMHNLQKKRLNLDSDKNVANDLPTLEGIPVSHHNSEGQIQRDVVEDVVLEGRKDKEVKATLASCMNKFKKGIEVARANASEEENIELTNDLSEDGRDAFFYRRVWWKNAKGLQGDIDRWEESWSINRTGGLLADIGLTLKNFEMFQQGLKFKEIMNEEYLQTGSNQVRGRSGAKTSEWSEDIKKSNIKGNAGPSSTTTQLLTVVSSIGTFTSEEIEIMMVALVQFWKGGMKKTFGKGYHTAAEVWAPYTGYMEAQDKQKEK